VRHFITGGSRGIGADLVVESARLGHDVAFTYRNAEEQALEVLERARAAGPNSRIRCFRLDVRNAEQVEDVLDDALDELGSIEVVVNNAGIARDNMLATMTNEEWDDVLATNLTGPFYVCRQVLPVMLSARFGRIVNLGSLAYSGSSGQANYAASKAGLKGLTQTIAKEYGRRGITANMVVPGVFDTDMVRDNMPPHIREFWRTYCPVPDGRLGELSELSALINFLASREAAFVNGQVIHATGGLDWGP
jgi:NAD(P)-dependent dehydrogenase (short-subunit alcohol dehydrogenase family)